MSEETRKNLSGATVFSIQLSNGIIVGFAAIIFSLLAHQSKLIINYSTACCYIAQLDQQGARPRRLYDA